MRDEKLADGLTDDVADWLVLVAALAEVEWHKFVDVVFQALWLVDDDLSQRAQVHVLLLLLG